MPRLVLLIDWDDDTREMYAEFLKSVGLDLVEAADGRDGLAQALSHNPDVVVTGTRLPGIDGYELCALLRHDPTTRTTPIVVVTGDGYEADIARARAAGADSVLVKPCLPYALFDEIRTVVRRVRESQPAVLPLPATEVPPHRAAQGAHAWTPRSGQGAVADFPPPRHDAASDGSSRPCLSRLRSPSRLSEEPHRRGERAARRAVGRLRMPGRLRNFSVPAADAHASKGILVRVPSSFKF